MNDREEDPNERIPETIEIKFKNSSNKLHYYYKAKCNDTIAMLKLHYQNSFKVPAQRLHFFWEWTTLEDHRSLASYGMEDFAVIRVQVLNYFDAFLIISILSLIVVVIYGLTNSGTMPAKVDNEYRFFRLL
ncbi:hypothetical protein B9Z55_007477 [Caenorhabditis nigoni]|uniref:Ubiquitin-like domain-containing protein n=1 Tax=Caenorhabditis nigoni TaxID=1611254 RepID=A0A2G5VA00_9PELO|nr:hypothetical protein B9Z55_007477 [Caenorhabditis nigoni]